MEFSIRKFGIANSLTAFRMICIPFFVLFFVLKYYELALAIYCLGALSDMIDGSVARLLKEKSQFGALLDPIADKACMLTVFITLAIAAPEVMPVWFIGIILIRDAVVTAGFIYVRVKKIDYKVRAILSSKFATLGETVAGTFALIYVVWPHGTIWKYPIGDITYGSILVASVLILVATMRYLKIGIDLVDQQSK